MIRRSPEPAPTASGETRPPMPLEELDRWLRKPRQRQPVAESLSMLDGIIAAIVAGPAKLYGQRMSSPDIRAGMALLIASLCPFVFKMSGMIYLVGAIVLGAGFLFCAIQFSRQLTPARARQLFLASIIYLPLLLALMVWDKVK